MNNPIILLFLITISLQAMPQDTEKFIRKVLENHPGVVSEKKMLLTREAESYTGYTPANPNIILGYFPGIPSEVGNKITWSVSQSLDFPSRYKRLKILGENNYEQAVMEYKNSVLMLLAYARAKAIELVALRKHIEILEERIDHIGKMENAYKKMLDEGEITVIDHNKIMLTGAGMKNKLLEYRTREDVVYAFLNMVSGNNAYILDHVLYPIFEEPDPEILLAEKKSMHPAFKIPEKEIEIAGNRLDVLKTKSMPGLQVGFASEIVAASQFTGPTIGISIPLWENKGRIEAERARKRHYEAEYINLMMIYENEFRTRYARYISVKNGLQELRNSYSDSVSTELLNKSLAVGEISIIEYFLELSAFYDIEDKIIELEKEFYTLLAELYNHFPDLNILQN